MKFTKQTVQDSTTSIHTEERVLDISVKPGWKRGTQVTFHDEGNVEPGIEPADICFVLQELPHPFYTRDNNNLIYTATITLAQSLTGVKLILPCLDGVTREISIRDIIHPKYQYCVVGAGMPITKGNGSTFGDLVIRFDIQFPSRMTAEDKTRVKDILLANVTD
eukprot:TRINITY_DN3862_c0_g2_i3.p1 TRINITY_DN3862_c0_g2~~TRINITY_DN3862_c0_g2_i3.p1  ORF type:complete len:164 (+),score=27.92 TRINITY_DN3862_c0_g2_i3:686-1177(+)